MAKMTVLPCSVTSFRKSPLNSFRAKGSRPGGFVGEEEGRIVQKGTCQRHPLAHPRGKGLIIPVEILLHSENPGRLPDFFPGFRAVQIVKRGEKFKIFPGREPPVKSPLVAHREADGFPDFRGAGQGREAVHPDLSFVGEEERGEELEECRLPGAVRAHQGKKSPGFDPEIDFVERLDSRPPLPETPERKEGREPLGDLPDFNRRRSVFFQASNGQSRPPRAPA